MRHFTLKLITQVLIREDYSPLFEGEFKTAQFHFREEHWKTSYILSNFNRQKHLVQAKILHFYQILVLLATCHCGAFSPQSYQANQLRNSCFFGTTRSRTFFPQTRLQRIVGRYANFTQRFTQTLFWKHFFISVEPSRPTSSLLHRLLSLKIKNCQTCRM